MNIPYLCIFLSLLICVQNSSLKDELKLEPQPKPHKFKVHYVETNSTYNFIPSKRGFFEKHLNTYCYRGQAKTLGRLLETIELHLDIEGDDYTQYDGTKPQEVEQHYSEHRSLFSFSLFSQKRSRLPLSPFAQQCIGIETIQPYTVRLVQEKIDYMRLIMLLTGVIVFIFAGYLSKNSIFYYITGIVFGICSSFLLLIWLSAKLMPKKTMMYGVVIGGWTIGLYILRMLWHNLQLILVTYRNYVCWYIVITGLVSFLFCYRWGPPKNRRSKNIIKWLLQLISLAFIYISSNFKEAIIAIIAIIVILYYFPRTITNVMSFKGEPTGNSYSKSTKTESNNMMRRELRNDCNQWAFTPNGKEKKVSPRLSINSHLNNDYAPDQLSESDISSNETNAPQEKLYPLPDGSFILSERPPKIFTPHQSEDLLIPIYHRSTPTMMSDDNNDIDSDHTPLPHHRLPLVVTNTRRLTSASSTSELCVKKGRRSIQSPSQFQRSNSLQRGHTRSPHLMVSAKKNAVSSSPPKIKIFKSEIDE